MLSYLKQIGLCVVVSSLVACSHMYGDNGVIKNRDNDYLKAKDIAPMQVPPGYNQSSIKDNYPVPDKRYPESNPRVDLTPPGLAPVAPTPTSN